jgi:hypothetical protein
VFEPGRIAEGARDLLGVNIVQFGLWGRIHPAPGFEPGLLRNYEKGGLKSAAGEILPHEESADLC